MGQRDTHGIIETCVGPRKEVEEGQKDPFRNREHICAFRSYSTYIIYYTYIITILYIYYYYIIYDTYIIIILYIIPLLLLYHTYITLFIYYTYTRTHLCFPLIHTCVHTNACTCSACTHIYIHRYVIA